MIVKIIAIGKLKAGAEAELVARYHKRALPLASALGIKAITMVEGVEGKQDTSAQRKATEAAFISSHLQGISFALDERGETMSSESFAKTINDYKDSGQQQLNFIIGGADGLDETVRAKSRIISFGKMTMPHQLVRVLLCEQIYRAMTLLNGHPYHRV